MTSFSRGCFRERQEGRKGRAEHWHSATELKVQERKKEKKEREEEEEDADDGSRIDGYGGE